MDDLDIFKKALKKAKFPEYYAIQGLAKDVYAIIFSHKFAQDFWGQCTKWWYYIDGDCMETVEEKPAEWEHWEDYKEANGWKYHLQKMVLEENPLKYIEQFLGEN